MSHTVYFLAHDKLQSLLDALHDAKYRCIGPQIRQGAVVYDTLSDVAQLPQGMHDHQAPGEYRLSKQDDTLYFAWANGPQAIKPQVFASEEVLWQSTRRDNGELSFFSQPVQTDKIAIIGARACDLAALFIQDKHFLQQQYKDQYYASRRHNLVIIAVNCTHPAATCFCHATGDGPKAEYGFDLALTELEEGFLLESRSEFGLALIDRLKVAPANDVLQDKAQHKLSAAARMQTRSIPTGNLYPTFLQRLDHPRWQEVAERCLSCGNCTSVCPTCFCHREEEHPALNGTHSEHVRLWDSCFTPGHSYIHGLTVRANTDLRYRQWLMHKLGSWHEQYGRSGCVGCGRCITWCPVGIDLTEEVTAICGDGT